MSRKYKFHHPAGRYFLSPAVVYWVDVFTRSIYKEIVIDSLQYCIQQKGLILYAYVIMRNPIHLIVSKQQGASAFCDIMRDFKKVTSMQRIKAMKANPQESRKEWLLNMLAAAGKQNSNNTTYQFWPQDNPPIALEGNWIDEKLAYIHNLRTGQWHKWKTLAP